MSSDGFFWSAPDVPVYIPVLIVTNIATHKYTALSRATFSLSHVWEKDFQVTNFLLQIENIIVARVPTKIDQQLIVVRHH